MSNAKLVLIDASWLAYRAKYAMKGLSHEDAPIGVLFGFLEQLRTTCLNPKVGSSRVVVCFDSKQSIRKKAFPFYKDRTKRHTPEEWADIDIMKDQVKRLRKEILPSIGIPCLRQTGLEADDMMAQAVSQLGGDHGIMITADGDLFQCITDEVHWYDPSPARNLYLDPASMRHTYRVGPTEWVDVKCMAGCHSDTVPGVPGVADKTAIDYLWKLLKKDHKRYQAIVSDKGQAIIKRNYGLVALPHAATRPVDLTQPVYNVDALFKWGEKLGFKSYFEGGRRRQWELFFSGQTSVIDRQNVRRRT